MTEQPVDDDPVVPERSDDDGDRGWGEPPDPEPGHDDDERFTREKPPHWT